MEMYTADGPLTVDGSEMHFGSGEHEEEEDNVLPQSGSAASEEVTVSPMNPATLFSTRR